MLIGRFLYETFSLGQPYITTGEVLSFGRVGHKGVSINAATVKLDNGQEALIKNEGFSIGDTVRLECYYTEGNKTQTCKVIE